MPRGIDNPSWIAWSLPWALFGALCAGCAEETAPSPSVKTFAEPLTAEDWGRLERIVKDLGENPLKDLPSVFPPPPDWQPTRTLAVADLVAAEQRLLDEAWEPRLIAPRLSPHSELSRRLRREQLSAEQFVGLVLTVGAAMARLQLNGHEPPEETLRRGRKIVDGLKSDRRIFSALEVDERAQILDQAVWLHRLDRIERLRQVPPENLELAQKHSAWLVQVLPACFLVNPLADLADVLGEQGVPFLELPESGSDVRLDWDPREAIIGR
jgi:hypothetical protein